MPIKPSTKINFIKHYGSIMDGFLGNQEIMSAVQSKESNKVELKYTFKAKKSMNLETYR